MTFKRVVIIMVVMLMLTGMAVSTTAEYDFDAIVEIGTPVACEATKPEYTTTQTPAAFEAEIFSLQTTNRKAEPTEPVTTMKLVKNQTALEEGTIVDPNVDVSAIVLEKYTWDGEVLDSYNGTVPGPNGKETYYNLDMTGVIWIMEDLGYDYEYSVREDGVKMYGPFIMVAADLDLRPRGSIIKTSLGWAMVCDTGGFTAWNPTQLDIATAW